MQPEARDPAYLRDMRDAGSEAVAMLAGVSREAFEQDKQRRFAVERLMTILGEAARRVSETFKATHPEIPWAGINAFRNVLIHDYGTVRADRVWHIVTTDVPPLLATLDLLIGGRTMEP